MMPISGFIHASIATVLAQADAAPAKVPLGDEIERVVAAMAKGIGQLPWSTHAVVFTALGVGLVLWLAGYRFLRLGFALLGAAVGAAVGHFAPPALGMNVSPLLATGIGVVAGVLIATLVYKLAVAASLGGVFALLGAGACALFLTVAPAQTQDAASLGEIVQGEVDRAGDAVREAIDDQREALDDAARDLSDVTQDAIDNATGQNPTATERAGRAIRDAGEELRDFFEALWRDLSPLWDGMSTATRLALVGAAVVGAAVGVLLGLILPKRGAAVLSAMLGVSAWLPAAWWLLRAMGVEVERLIPGKPVVWLAIWLGLVAVGTILQWMQLKRKSDKAQ